MFTKVNNLLSDFYIIGKDNIPYLKVADRQIEVDNDGYLWNLDDWNEDVAEVLAKTVGVDELTEEHWKVVFFIQTYYRENDCAPTIRELCKKTSCTLIDIYRLFPSGPASGACKVAGTPKPNNCLLS